MRQIFLVLGLALTPYLAFADEENISELRLTSASSMIGAPVIATGSDARPSAATLNTPKESLVEAAEDEDLLRLAEEVEALRNRLVVEKAISLNTQTPRKVKVSGMRTIYNYRDNAIYQILSAPDHVTDISLQPGESLTSTPTAGDTVRWSVSPMKSGAGPRETTHLILKPLEFGIETNLIVTTDKHTYHLRLQSGETHMPSVAWNYPQEESLKMEALLRKREQEEPISPTSLRFDYRIDGESYSWRPLRVFDDGTKTYIQMPSTMRSSDAPALFVLDESSEPMLVNYRVKGDFYLVDRLFEQAELKVGTHKTVSVCLKSACPNFFERLFN